jgi:hypothetical protein
MHSLAPIARVGRAEPGFMVNFMNLEPACNGDLAPGLCLLGATLLKNQTAYLQKCRVDMLYWMASIFWELQIEPPTLTWS